MSMKDELEAALQKYEATRKNYRDSDLMRAQAGYDLSKSVLAILTAATGQEVGSDVDSLGDLHGILHAEEEADAGKLREALVMCEKALQIACAWDAVASGHSLDDRQTVATAIYLASSALRAPEGEKP